MKGLADRIGLNHISHKSERKDQRYREKSRQKLSKASLEYVFYIVDRSPGNSPVLHHTRFLGHDSLRIDGSHSEKCTDPHPEDGSRTSGSDSRSRSRNISCSDLRRYGSSQRLE